ncbi:MAG: hypothetical protein K1X29_03145 [Bdellovibrionales bacterium]|nr:hypothetical protein [Bdellovibrionales bacterium]
MNQNFYPLRSVPKSSSWGVNDVVVIFGEVFQRGYVNGLIEEAKKSGAKVIYSTVGRRENDGKLRPLTAEELQEKDHPLINVPLEAGFDLFADKNGKTVIDQLQGLKLSEWQNVKLYWDEIEELQREALQDFKKRLERYFVTLNDYIPNNANVLFVHTMAGGVPRAKIVMPAMNRVFKGFGDRYASSSEFWNSDLGQLCDRSFMEVTAQTFRHFVEMSAPLRKKIERNGKKASYVAYGYHGTEVLMGDSYQWQSYSPYLQGFAKLALENLSMEFTKEGLNCCVFNAPEILTNSSSIFLGVEVSLYPLLGALAKEGSLHKNSLNIVDSCLSLLQKNFTLNDIMEVTQNYFNHPVIKQWSNFSLWPQHNGPEQMTLMRQTSTQLIEMHQDQKNLMTAILSEIVFRACGNAMWKESFQPRHPVSWVGHDFVAQWATAESF